MAADVVSERESTARSFARAVVNFLWVLIPALPLYALAVFILASLAFVLTADHQTVTFGEYVRSMQSLPHAWPSLATALAIGGTAWRVAWYGPRR